MKLQNTTFNCRLAGIRCRHLHMPLLVTCFLVLLQLSTGDPVHRTTPPYHFNVSKSLQDARKMCAPGDGSGVAKVIIPHDAWSNATTIYLQQMQDQINLTLLELSNWQKLPGNDISWNSQNRSANFTLLLPFLKKTPTWERRLQIYCIALHLVKLFHKKYSESTNIPQSEEEALERVNEQNQQLLSLVKEYQALKKTHKRPIDADDRKRLIQNNQALKKTQKRSIDADDRKWLKQFNITDASEIRIHIWYIMCRLNCFLKNMQEHLYYLRGREQGHKRSKIVKCEKCPHNRQLNKQSQKKNQEKDKQKKEDQKKDKQQKLQRKKQQRGQHGRKAHDESSKPSKQPKSPKGKKGVRKSNTKQIGIGQQVH